MCTPLTECVIVEYSIQAFKCVEELNKLEIKQNTMYSDG